MTKQQIEAHRAIIEWFIQPENTDKGVWYRCSDDELDIIKDPTFSPLYTYVQNDEYAELRKHLADGKGIVYKFGRWSACNEDRWLDLKVSPTSVMHDTEWKFKENVDLVAVRSGGYKIKPKEFKVGNWVTINDGKPKQFKRFTRYLPEWNKTLDYENIEMICGYKEHIYNFDRSIVKLWKPKEGEYAIFDDYDYGYIIGKLIKINDKDGWFHYERSNGKVKEICHKTKK